MTVSRVIPVLAAALACLAVPRAGATEDANKADFAEITLKNGISVGFGLLRLGSDAPQGALPLAGHVFPGSIDAVTRLLIDEQTGAVFGYRLGAVGLSNTMPVMKVEIHPLAETEAAEVSRLPRCPGCPAPRLVSSSSIRIPPPQFVRAGDVLVVDLLVRPATGEKIVDVLKFSADKVSRLVVDEVRGRIGQAFLHRRQGDDSWSKGQMEDAASAYLRALALQPDASTHARLGGSYQRLERPRLARDQYQRAVQLNPGDAITWHNLAVLLHREDRYGDAIDAYRRALKLVPDWPLARHNLATVLLDRGDVGDAVREYRAAGIPLSDALMKDPACVKARDAAAQQYAFARVHAARGDADTAFAALRRARDGGFKGLHRIVDEPEFRSLRKDPRLVGLIPLRPRS